MKKNKIALQILTFGLIVISFIACDDDYATLESDVINDDVATNFDILSEQHDIIAYTKALGPVQTNDLEISTLGLYDDLYGRTTSSFVAQLSPDFYDPDFGDDTTIDSVVVTIPYFSYASDFDEEGNTIYEIDSILPKGDTYAPIKLSIFENGYFLRDFDPDAGFNESQAYYSNKSASSAEMFETALQGEELTMLRGPQSSYLPDNPENTITINENAYILEGVDTDEDDDTDPQILEQQAPSIRVKLDPDYWQNKIIEKEGDPVLSNQNSFIDYFRGLYFKAEPVNNDGSYLLLNTTDANVTIYFKYTNTTENDEGEDEVETLTSTYTLSFGPNKVNFFENNFTQPIPSGASETGDSRIYLKGGEGAVAGIKLFNGEDLDDSPEMNTFESFKNTFVQTDEDGKFESSKRLVNEANLVFYVDRNQLDMLNEDPDNEPNRIYLYDVDNKTPLLDYFLDGTNSNVPSLSKYSHLGPLERQETDNKGVRYKLRITEHINNLLLRDSTNVELGLAVSLSVNIEESTIGSIQKKVQDTDEYTVPVSSLLTPRGTILHGNNSEDETKRVYLEIYYTEPN